MVLDFYGREWTTEKLIVMPHGFELIYAKSINKVFNLPNKALLRDKIITTPWTVNASGERTLASQWLKPEAKFWIHWVKNRFSPTTHDSSIFQERLMIYYSFHKAI